MDAPRSLRLAAALTAIQALALAVWGLGDLIRSIDGHPSDRGTAILLGAVVLSYAVGVALAARGLWQSRRWAQAPTYMVTFFAVVVGIGQIHTLPLLMIPLIVIGVATFAAVSMPDSRSALGGI
jgi:hypothetical protein